MLKPHHFLWPDTLRFRSQIQAFLKNEPHALVLDSQQPVSEDPHSAFDILVALRPTEIFTIRPEDKDPDFLSDLDRFIGKGEWVVGGLAYDVKNRLEHLHSQQPDYFGAPDVFFFKPSLLFLLKGQTLTIWCEGSADVVFRELCSATPSQGQGVVMKQPMQPLVTREAYLERVAAIQEHILDGDVYELNYCQAFIGEADISDPCGLFFHIAGQHQAPFSCYVRHDAFHLLSASPERFLCRRGGRVIAQPIKGTRRRGADAEQDRILREELIHSEKDRAENVMIVDLMRNDLSRFCRAGSVKVDELFGIYTFAKVIHMISTISGEVKGPVSFGEIVRCAFPMGSMTGAPKVRSMQLIDEYECFRRSWFSGAFGYIAPSGDFDFNVVIRSLLYNDSTNTLLAPVGGAIVYDSDPNDEYAETLVKIQPVLNLIQTWDPTTSF